MDQSDQPLTFPQYAPPNPQGVPVADPKAHKPLFKLARQMLKPRTRAVRPVHKSIRKKPKRWY